MRIQASWLLGAFQMLTEDFASPGLVDVRSQELANPLHHIPSGVQRARMRLLARVHISTRGRRGQAVARVRGELEHYLEEVVAGLPLQGVTTEKAVRIGDAAEEIIKYAREQNVDLIMMATHGRTALSRAIFGSVADRVATSGAAPVLLVRPESKK